PRRRGILPREFAQPGGEVFLRGAGPRARGPQRNAQEDAGNGGRTAHGDLHLSESLAAGCSQPPIRYEGSAGVKRVPVRPARIAPVARAGTVARESRLLKSIAALLEGPTLSVPTALSSTRHPPPTAGKRGGCAPVLFLDKLPSAANNANAQLLRRSAVHFPPSRCATRIS